MVGEEFYYQVVFTILVKTKTVVFAIVQNTMCLTINDETNNIIAENTGQVSYDRSSYSWCQGVHIPHSEMS